MSIGHDLTVLELESQIDVLSRIQFVSRFGSNLVHIEGVKGSGKSWLAQRYLEKWSDDANQALLMCHKNQTIQQQRGIILKQVVRDPLFNEFDTVVDSIGRMLAGETCNLLLVIDDAHLLSTELLSELWLLVQKAQSTPNWQINVLLFSEAGKLTPALSRMSYGQDNKPIDIDIELLSAEEAATFTEMLVVRFKANGEEKRRIRNLVDKSNRLPAELIALGEKKKERRVISSNHSTGFFCCRYSPRTRYKISG
jgi:DamX protein